ncbi:hypothetical protein C8035_v006090 [Colletotrichum spinosum]|uniref:Uncharacterized protein n=1 Tax=Colletotrichum spinosum TaxID=1347390 RepID=A0A4R8Q7F7_9PEZI|nr:hypothetical protein C8035_v006090 [Colletotrichum spinosum]
MSDVSLSPKSRWVWLNLTACQSSAPEKAWPRAMRRQGDLLCPIGNPSGTRDTSPAPKSLVNSSRNIQAPSYRDETVLKSQGYFEKAPQKDHHATSRDTAFTYTYQQSLHIIAHQSIMTASRANFSSGRALIHRSNRLSPPSRSTLQATLSEPLAGALCI